MEAVVSLGDPAAEINRIAARSGVGLIAMATRGRDRLEKRMMGSVANDVVQSTHVPCLLIRPPTATSANSTLPCSARAALW